MLLVCDCFGFLYGLHLRTWKEKQVMIISSLAITVYRSVQKSVKFDCFGGRFCFVDFYIKNYMRDVIGVVKTTFN